MLRSIPPITSTGPTRSRRMKSSTQSIRIGGIGIGGSNTGDAGGTGESDWLRNIQPANRRRSPSPHAPLPSFPERAEPEVSEDEKNVWVVVEFPGHSDMSKIKWAEEGDVLSVESTFINCPYTNKIALPQNRGERVDVKLNNGLFIVTFERQYPS